MRTGRLAGLLLLLFTLTLSVEARADRYFVVLFAREGPRFNPPRKSHTWARFIRTDDRGAGDHGTGDRGTVEEVVDVNWLPADRKFTIWAKREPGLLFDSADEARYSCEADYRVYGLGPFEITQSLFEEQREIAAALAKGMYWYRALDALHRRGQKNCIHPFLDDSDGTPGQRTGLARGLAATRKVARSFVPDILARPVNGLVPIVPEAMALFDLRGFEHEIEWVPLSTFPGKDKRRRGAF